MARTAIPKGTDLFHGTNVEEDFRVPNGPAWFGNAFTVAKYFATYHGDDGTPRVYHYRVKRRITGLLLIETREEYDRQMEQLAQKTGRSQDVHGDAEIVCEAGLNGWVIPNNYPDGADIMLCRPEDWIEFVEVAKLED